MQLTAQELEQFDEQGYVFRPSTFTEDEVNVLKQGARDVYACLLYTSPSPRD